MKQISISGKLSIGFIGVILVTSLVVGFLATRYMRENAVANLEQNVDEIAKLIAAWQASQPSYLWSDALLRQIREISEETDFDIDIALATGEWRASSGTLANLPEDPLRLPEFMEARHQGRGYATKDTADGERLYVVRPILLDWEFIGFVRVGTSTASVLAEEQVLRNRIILITVFIAVAVALASYLVNRQIMKPLFSIADTCRRISGGDLDSRMHIHRSDELGVVAGTVDQMADALSQQIRGEKRQRRQLESLLSLLNDAVIVVDGDGQTTFANTKARPFLTTCSVTGKAYGSVIALESLRALIDEHFEHGSYGQEEIRWDLSEDEVRYFEVFFAEMPDHRPGRSGVLIVLHDVTEQKSFENLRREFASNVSHELKTPITAIGAIVDALGDTEMEGDMRGRFLQRLEHQNQRMLRLVNELLTLTKLESGSNILDYKRIEFDRLEHALRETFESVARNRDIAFSVELEPDLPVFAADPRALEVILNSLVDNAIQHTPRHGEVTVSIVKEADAMLFAVEDTGAGIAPEHQERIFERFYRVDPDRSRERGGSGMGLAIVKHLSTAHGGTVSLTSAVGQGSRFEVRLPFNRERQHDEPTIVGTPDVPRGLLGLDD